MSDKPELEVIAGQVVDVQLTSETIVNQQAAAAPTKRKGRPRGAAPQAIITGRMRIFLKDPQGRDPHYDFEECELGVHEDQNVVIVRTKPRNKRAEPMNMLLANRSSGQDWMFEHSIVALTPPPAIGALWKAGILCVPLFIGGHYLSRYVISPEHTMMWWIWWPLMFTVLAFPVLWGAAILYDSMSLAGRRKRLRAYVREQARARATEQSPAAAA